MSTESKKTEIQMATVMKKSDFNIKKERKPVKKESFLLEVSSEEFHNLPNWAQSGIVERLSAEELPATVNRKIGVSPFLSKEQKEGMKRLLLTPELTTPLDESMNFGL